MSYQQPPSSSSNNNLPPFDWSLPGRNIGGGPPPLMGMPNRDDVRLPSTMERVLKFRDNQHEEDRVTKLHSGSGHQTDSGIEQNDEYEYESDEETTPENGLSRKAKKEIEKRRRRRRAKKKTKSAPPPPPPRQSSEPPRKESSRTDDKKKEEKT